ncbi:TIGR03618 family F420-dependent PPOX class oxidoreductase [Myxococcota bacterium]|nr:TIGR03618 family F420-dependent PPOX class oxidoreductase [Myxococcota bacterium]
MGKRLTDDMKRLIDSAGYAHLATLEADGSPKVEPVWLGREGDRLLVATDRKSRKSINLERDPRVAISLIARDNPYEQLLIRGRVVEDRSDDDLVGLDALSQAYLGKPFPRRKWSSRVLYVIEATVARYHVSPLEDPRT